MALRRFLHHFLALAGLGLTLTARRAPAQHEHSDHLHAPSSHPGSGEDPQAELTAILDFSAAYFSDDEPLETGAHDPDHTGFNFQQLELSIRGDVEPYFHFDSSLVFTPFEVEIEEAYVTTLSLPADMQARFGLFLTSFGRINATHLHAWDFVDQPFEIGRLFGPEGNRGLGVEASVMLPLPWSVELIGSVTEAGGEGTARSFYGADDLGVESLADLQYTTALKQLFTLSRSWSLALGVSGAFGPNSTGSDNRTDIYGADTHLEYRSRASAGSPRVSLQSEAFYRRRQVPGDLLQDVGGYSQLLYRMSEQWSVAGRYEYGSPAYGESGNVATDPLDPEWTELRRRYSGALTFYPNEASRFRLQGNLDVPGYRDAYWACFLAAEVVVGVHDAHSF